jgi:polysaccharide pyruvyl transferase WcaK-like protein
VNYLLEGYYGMYNYGDDVFLHVLVSEIARLDPAARFTVIADPRIHPADAARITLDPGRRLGTVRAVRANDVWLFGGGGLVQDRTERSRMWLRKTSHIAKVAKLARRGIVLLGMGVGPIDTAVGRSAATRLLDAADIVTVRDPESAAIAKELTGREAFVTGDLAFSYLGRVRAERPSVEPDAPVLGVNLLAYSTCRGEGGEQDHRIAKSLAAALNQLMTDFPQWRVKLLECFNGAASYSDAVILRAMQSQLAYPERVSYHPYTGDYPSTAREIASCTAFFGMRFHSCVTAYAAGLPFLMVDIQPKSVSLGKLISYPPERLLSVDVLEDHERLGAFLRELVVAREMPARVHPAQMIDCSSHNFRLLGTWLASRKGR